jgi:hypothetical protein
MIINDLPKGMLEDADAFLAKNINIKNIRNVMNRHGFTDVTANGFAGSLGSEYVFVYDQIKVCISGLSGEVSYPDLSVFNLMGNDTVSPSAGKIRPKGELIYFDVVKSMEQFEKVVTDAKAKRLRKNLSSSHEKTGNPLDEKSDLSHTHTQKPTQESDMSLNENEAGFEYGEVFDVVEKAWKKHFPTGEVVGKRVPGGFAPNYMVLILNVGGNKNEYIGGIFHNDPLGIKLMIEILPAKLSLKYDRNAWRRTPTKNKYMAYEAEKLKLRGQALPSLDKLAKKLDKDFKKAKEVGQKLLKDDLFSVYRNKETAGGESVEDMLARKLK